jgi:ABC-2 type transport system permease protein
MTMGARVEDVRYRGYHGERRGPYAGIIALARFSGLRALGAGRSWRAKIIPVGLTLAAFGPAFVILGVRALFADRIRADLSTVLPYNRYYGVISMVLVVFVAIVTPELLCPDRRDRVLDLYYGTAISPRRYLAGKYLGAFAPMLLVTLLPVAFLYTGNVLFADHPLGYLQDHLGDGWRIIAAGLAIAVYYASLGLAISSLTSRRAFAMGGLAGLLVLSSAVSGILTAGLNLSHDFDVTALPLIPVLLVQHLFPSNTPFEGPSGAAWLAAYVVVVVTSLLILLRRYR